jgi:hypothetical protein
MAIVWMRTSDAFPDLDRSDKDFTAFAGNKVIGRVYQFEAGPEQGIWFWSMTADRPGPRFAGRSGREGRRGDAGRRVVEAYERLLDAPSNKGRDT